MISRSGERSIDYATYENHLEILRYYYRIFTHLFCFNVFARRRRENRRKNLMHHRTSRTVGEPRTPAVSNRVGEQQGTSPQNRTADAGDAGRVRRRCTSARFLAARPVHLSHLARSRERDSLENRLLIRDVGNSGDRTVRTCGGRGRPRGGRTWRLIARQGRRRAHSAVTPVSSA